MHIAQSGKSWRCMCCTRIFIPWCVALAGRAHIQQYCFEQDARDTWSSLRLLFPDGLHFNFVAVVKVHLGIPKVSSGLSGTLVFPYLIPGLSLSTFYVRRLLRVLPIQWACSILSWAIGGSSSDRTCSSRSLQGHGKHFGFVSRGPKLVSSLPRHELFHMQISCASFVSLTQVICNRSSPVHEGILWADWRGCQYRQASSCFD